MLFWWVFPCRLEDFYEFSLEVSILIISSSLCLCIFLWLAGFTDQPGELRGFPVHTHLTKGSRGFGFNIVGGSRPREFLQVYSVTASGPSALKTGRNTLNKGRLRHGKANLNVLLFVMQCMNFETRYPLKRGRNIFSNKETLLTSILFVIVLDLS